MRKLSDAQAKVLRLLDERGLPPFGAVCTAWISKKLGKRFDNWTVDQINALKGMQFVSCLSLECSRVKRWGITEEGRAFLKTLDSQDPSHAR